ncbi:MAG: 2OG-Fe(II) oxygenase [Myxococcales bacterium]|nr:2OG-Fe(II) oxygenase [Myxococcales bacterium]
MEDFVRVYDGALASAECADMVARFDRDRDHQFSGTVSGPQGESIQSDLKQAAELLTQSPGWEDVDELLYGSLARHLDLYLRDVEALCSFPGSGLGDQSYRIRRYAAGQGFDWHIDNASEETFPRVLAAQWYLNTVERGGETEFRASGRKIACVEGRLALFPVQWTLSHRGVPPVSGPKYVGITFFHPRF